MGTIGFLRRTQDRRRPDLNRENPKVTGWLYLVPVLRSTRLSHDGIRVKELIPAL